MQPIFESWKIFYECEIEEHIKNIENNKNFWKSASDNHNLVDRIEMPKVVITTLKFDRPQNISKSKDTSGSSMDISTEGILPREKRPSSFFEKLTRSLKEKTSTYRVALSGSDIQSAQNSTSNTNSDELIKKSYESIDALPKKPFFKRFTVNKKNSGEPEKKHSSVAEVDKIIEENEETGYLNNKLARRRTSVESTTRMASIVGINTKKTSSLENTRKTSIILEDESVMNSKNHLDEENQSVALEAYSSSDDKIDQPND